MQHIFIDKSLSFTENFLNYFGSVHRKLNAKIILNQVKQMSKYSNIKTHNPEFLKCTVFHIFLQFRRQNKSCTIHKG